MLDYIVQRPPAHSLAPDFRLPTLVVLHGYGADAQDLIPIAEQAAPDRLIISLQAPIPLSNGGYAWYYLAQTPSGLIPDELSRHESEDAIIEGLATIIEREGGDPHNIILMGFSQGAAILYSLATLYTFRNHGFSASCIIAMSGYVPRDILEAISQIHFDGFRFLITHGEFDDLVPPMALNEASELLTQHGANVTAKTYDCGHGVLPETVEDIKAWLAQNNIL